MSPWPVGLRLVETVRAAGLDADAAAAVPPAGSTGPAAPAATMPGAVPATAPEHRFDPERTVAAFGGHLGRLHRLGRPGGVVAVEPGMLVESARRRLATGELTSKDLSAAYRHMDPARLVEILADGLDDVDARAAVEAPVIVHGRPVLGNFRFRLGEPLGFCDWSAIAVADRHRDLAIAASDVAEVFGAVVVPVFFDAYGDPPPDPRSIDWYALADALVGA